jgi:hypothetical protein
MCRSVPTIALVVFLSILMTGCFGYVSVLPVACDKETLPSDARVAEKQKMLPSAGPQKADFLELWGEPDLIEKTSATTEIWTYKRKRWCGGIPAFFIAVPLLLPVCDAHEIIEFRDNVATGLQITEIADRGALFGIGGMLHPTETPCDYPLLEKLQEMNAPSDTALVYYYRKGPYRPVLERNYSLYIDDKCAGKSLHPPSFYVFKLSPGPHVFEKRGLKLTIDAEAGKTYFIKEEGYFFPLYPDVSLVDGATGRKDLRYSRRIRIDATDPCGQTTTR